MLNYQTLPSSGRLPVFDLLLMRGNFLSRTSEHRSPRPAQPGPSIHRRVAVLEASAARAVTVLSYYAHWVILVRFHWNLLHAWRRDLMLRCTSVAFLVPTIMVVRLFVIIWVWRLAFVGYIVIWNKPVAELKRRQWTWGPPVVLLVAALFMNVFCPSFEM